MESVPVRIKLRLPFIIMAAIAYFFLLACPVMGSVGFMILAPARFGVPFGLGVITFSTLVAYVMSGSYQWIEICGDIIRVKNLLTRRVVVRAVADMIRVEPLFTPRQMLANAAIKDPALKKNRGYLLRFRGGFEVGLVRSEMAGLDRFMEELRDRLGVQWALVTT
jgi:hypothetical protein